MAALQSVRERPILFSAPMVRAILDGRKTQTRRVLDWKRDRFDVDEPIHVVRQSSTVWRLRHGTRPIHDESEAKCKYGAPGNRLWVKECAWFDRDRLNSLQCLRCFHEDGSCRFEDGRAIGMAPGYGAPGWTPELRAQMFGLNASLKKRASLFMPRWASRITLEVVSVRVERIQRITEADAFREGFDTSAPLEGFADTWDALNAKRGFGWDMNPWVWVIEFKRLEAA